MNMPLFLLCVTEEQVMAISVLFTQKGWALRPVKLPRNAKITQSTSDMEIQLTETTGSDTKLVRDVGQGVAKASQAVHRFSQNLITGERVIGLQSLLHKKAGRLQTQASQNQITEDLVQGSQSLLHKKAGRPQTQQASQSLITGVVPKKSSQKVSSDKVVTFSDKDLTLSPPFFDSDGESQQSESYNDLIQWPSPSSPQKAFSNQFIDREEVQHVSRSLIPSHMRTPLHVSDRETKLTSQNLIPSHRRTSLHASERETQQASQSLIKLQQSSECSTDKIQTLSPDTNRMQNKNVSVVAMPVATDSINTGETAEVSDTSVANVEPQASDVEGETAIDTEGMDPAVLDHMYSYGLPVSIESPIPFKHESTKMPVIEKPYACDKCDAKFTLKTALTKHKRVCCRLETCNVCGKKFHDEIQLAKHTKRHIKCLKCGSSFCSKQSLAIHSKVHTKKDPYMCQICDQTFKFKKTLNEHIPIHTSGGKIKPRSTETSSDKEKALIVCQVCQFITFSTRALKTHMKGHKMMRQFNCTVCESSYGSKMELNQHMHSDHPEVKKYSCPLCPYKTSRCKYILKLHMQTHNDVRMFECQTCNKKFKTNNCLRHHIRIAHTKNLTYICAECAFMTHNPSNLTRHMRRHGEKQWICEICANTFRQPCSLKQHMKIHTGDKPYQCEICQKQFRTLGEHKSHKISVHTTARPYVCDQCGQSFKMKGQLVSHKKVTHSDTKSFICDKCGKAFKGHALLYQHLRYTHNDTVACRCEKCGKSFRGQRNLQVHKKYQNCDKSNPPAANVTTVAAGS